MGKKANQTFLQRSVEMANKHMKICSKSLITKETQVKTRMRYHLTPVRMANIENSKTINAGENVDKKGMLLHCSWECKLIQPQWKTVSRFLKKNRNKTII